MQARAKELKNHLLCYTREELDRFIKLRLDEQKERLLKNSSHESIDSNQQSENKLQTDEELLVEYNNRINAGEKGVVLSMAAARGCSTQRIYALVNKAKKKNKPNAFDNLYKRN